MKLDKLRRKPWYPYAMAGCITVAVYVALTHLGDITAAVRTFLGFFGSVTMGAVVAYLLNPLAKLYQKWVFRKVKRDSLRWALSVGLALVTAVFLLVYFMGTLIPQLIESITMLVNNLDGYMASLRVQTANWELGEKLGLPAFLGSYEKYVDKAIAYLKDNLSGVLSVSMEAGKYVVNWVIAFILSVYLLTAKLKLKTGTKRLLRTLMPQNRFDMLRSFLSRCNDITSRYVTFSLVDAAIVGVVNAVFMQLLGMQYVGLVSIVVAVTNLVPTFGPVVGAVIGGFILLLVKPIHALIFIGFTLILQTIDGYVIKPRLFGKSLGVSGLLILISILVGGKMYGVLGILVAVPVSAILDFSYNNLLMPALEKRRKRLDTAEKEARA